MAFWVQSSRNFGLRFIRWLGRRMVEKKRIQWRVCLLKFTCFRGFVEGCSVQSFFRVVWFEVQRVFFACSLLIVLSFDGFVLGFGVEQASYGVQTQSYFKGGFLDGMCFSSLAFRAFGFEQDFSMFFKFRFDIISVNYCFVFQDFSGSSLNLFVSGFGKIRVFWCFF